MVEFSKTDVKQWILFLRSTTTQRRINMQENSSRHISWKPKAEKIQKKQVEGEK